MAIPLMNPRAQYAHLILAINERMAAVVDSGNFILGEHVSAFEQEVAAHLGVKHAIGLANGTDALVISLRALEIGPGDEVICPAYTFYATCESISAVGATPVFVDVDETWTLDVEAVRAAITGNTRAIMPVHLFGQIAAMDDIAAIAAEHDLAVIEDAAQAFGATLHGKHCGAWGDATTFSFFPTKNLGGFGDGGMIVTNRDDIAEMARMLRFHGSKDKKVFEYVGYNSRLDELQACVLRLFLDEIDDWNAKRRQVAAWYDDEGLGDLVSLPVTADGREHIYHLYTVRSDRRDDIAATLRANDVAAAVYYGEPHHLQPVYTGLGYGEGDLPVTETMSREGISLPMFPTMTRDQVATVVQGVRSALPAAAAGA